MIPGPGDTRAGSDIFRTWKRKVQSGSSVVSDEVEQWGVRVAKENAEEIRLDLLSAGLLDVHLKPRREGEQIIFPVTAPCEGAERVMFVPHPPMIELPPHELVGGIAILQDDDRDAAARLLAARPSLHTVLYAVSDVEGEFRTKRYKVLAGIPTTRTEYTEYGHRFAIDLEDAYFSARLATERRRLLDQTKTGEWVLDMFTGVGPFAITLAKKAELVIASDINPGAVRLMLRNISLNRVKNILPLLADARHLPEILPFRFDRVVMNLPLGSRNFLDAAFRLCKRGGTIHLYVLEEKEGEALPWLAGYPVAVIREHRVRSYSPARWHAVYDIEAGGEGDGSAGIYLVP
jgi:tRNA (guanine37-N1)-methyltransferase